VAAGVSRRHKETAMTEKGEVSAKDQVNHPAHYTAGSVECIDAIAAATTGLEGMEAVCTANVLKYVWRWKMKGGKTDLEKAKWYLDRLLSEVNKEPKK
jgi:hypothetical protein